MPSSLLGDVRWVADRSLVIYWLGSQRQVPPIGRSVSHRGVTTLAAISRNEPGTKEQDDE